MRPGFDRTDDRKDWETPGSVFWPLDEEFGFTLDVCASPHNAKCPRYYTTEDDGLHLRWAYETVWCNPPYGRGVGEWVKKAYQWVFSAPGTTVVMLLPARTDTRWFHMYINGKAEVRFLPGRIRFVGAENAAPFPSMVVVWR